MGSGEASDRRAPRRTGAGGDVTVHAVAGANSGKVPPCQFLLGGRIPTTALDVERLIEATCTKGRPTLAKDARP